MDIGDRLRQERERLHLNQVEFGRVGERTGKCVSKNTVLSWEAGLTSPTAQFLAAVAQLGVDVRWVVTGERDYDPPPPLTADENAVVEAYRLASSELRGAAMRTLQGERAKKGRDRIKIDGDVKQFAARDIISTVLHTGSGAARYAAHEPPPKKPKP